MHMISDSYTRLNLIKFLETEFQNSAEAVSRVLDYQLQHTSCGKRPRHKHA